MGKLTQHHIYYPCSLRHHTNHNLASSFLLFRYCFQFAAATTPFSHGQSRKFDSGSRLLNESWFVPSLSLWGETHTLYHVQWNPSCSTALLLDLFTLAASGGAMRPARPHRWAPAVETIMTLSTGLIKCQQQRDTVVAADLSHCESRGKSDTASRFGSLGAR